MRSDFIFPPVSSGVSGIVDVPGLQAELDGKLATTTTLDAIAAPTASVNFSQQQALSFVLENRTSDPGAPVTGQIWLRTDL